MTKLVSLPSEIGRWLVEHGCFRAVPFLKAEKFATYAKDRGLPVSRSRLMRLERLRAFRPMFRVRMPDEHVKRLDVPPTSDNNWFEKGWAWDTTTTNYTVPDDKDRTHEAYYSIFQVEWLRQVLNDLDFNMQIDAFIESETVDWQSNGTRWLKHGRQSVEHLTSNEFRPALGYLCQAISDRYWPHARGNERTIQVPGEHSIRFDEWTEMTYRNWDWHDFARKWDGLTVAS